VDLSFFHNLETGLSFRVLSTEAARSLACVYAPEIADKSARQLAAYRRMPDSVLFRVQRVRVRLDDGDLPGPTRSRVACSRCGQVIRDGRQIVREGEILCTPCTDACYFSQAQEVTWPDMSWIPQKEQSLC
jgi:formylmethanofuran dehydrogenase subunit E